MPKAPIRLINLTDAHAQVAQRVSPTLTRKVVRTILEKNGVRTFKPAGRILFAADDVEKVVPLILAPGGVK